MSLSEVVVRVRHVVVLVLEGSERERMVVIMGIERVVEVMQVVAVAVAVAVAVVVVVVVVVSHRRR